VEVDIDDIRLSVAVDAPSIALVASGGGGAELAARPCANAIPPVSAAAA